MTPHGRRVDIDIDNASHKIEIKQRILKAFPKPFLTAFLRAATSTLSDASKHVPRLSMWAYSSFFRAGRTSYRV